MPLEVPVAEHVEDVPPYQPGRAMASVAREFGLKLGNIVKLASNENPLGMSPRAQEVLAAPPDEPGRYPDADSVELREKLAVHHDIHVDFITVASGAAEILQLAARTFLVPGRSAVISQYAFTSYVRETRAVGARPIIAPARDYGHDPAALLAAIEADTSVMFLANPNNPTGTYISPDEMSEFLAAIPARVAIVLDEAYFDFVPDSHRPDSIAWVRRYPNLVIARTFSKIYGMAGVRIGYGIAQAEMTELLNRLRLTFNVSSHAQKAAIAALDDAEFIAASRAVTASGMAQLRTAFDRMGLTYVDSYANFILVRVGDAARINRFMLENGVIVRPVGVYGLSPFLRVTIGLPEENDRFLSVLDEAIRSTAQPAA